MQRPATLACSLPHVGWAAQSTRVYSLGRAVCGARPGTRDNCCDGPSVEAAHNLGHVKISREWVPGYIALNQ